MPCFHTSPTVPASLLAVPLASYIYYRRPLFDLLWAIPPQAAGLSTGMLAGHHLDFYFHLTRCEVDCEKVGTLTPSPLVPSSLGYQG